MVLNLIYAADSRFAMPVAVSLHSALRHLSPGRAVCVWIVDGGFAPSQRRRIREVARRGAAAREMSLRWITPSPEWWRGVTLDFSRSSLNVTTLYRLGMPYFLPPSEKRAVYLDGDTLVKGDIWEIVDQLPAGVGLAATPDYCFPTWGKRYVDRQDALRVLSVDPDKPYFNAGAIVVDLEYWREHQVVARTADFLARFPKLAWLADQDGLNYAMLGKWHALPLSWNFHPMCRDSLSRRGWSVHDQLGQSYEELQATANIVHFTGAKPWNQGYTNPERHAWISELKKSGYFNLLGYQRWLAGWRWNFLRRVMKKTWRFKIYSRFVHWGLRTAA